MLLEEQPRGGDELFGFFNSQPATELANELMKASRGFGKMTLERLLTRMAVEAAALLRYLLVLMATVACISNLFNSKSAAHFFTPVTYFQLTFISPRVASNCSSNIFSGLC